MGLICNHFNIFETGHPGIKFVMDYDNNDEFVTCILIINTEQFV